MREMKSKKSNYEIIRKIRGDWGAISPVTKIIPNKKKNIFARLFNPSVAHKILFLTDTPMLVVPV